MTGCGTRRAEVPQAGARRGWRAALAGGVLFGLALCLGPTASTAAEEAIDWRAVRERTAELLSGYIRIDTTNPPGRELAGARYLAAFLEGEGIETRILVSQGQRGNLIARLPATEPEPPAGGPVLLLSHIDVVPADPRDWKVPPFSGAIRDGFVHGRGALDDKGHGVVQAMALALLARHGGPRHRDVILAATAGEEADPEVGVAWLVEHHLAELGPPEVVWNEGGASTRHPLIGSETLNAVATTEKRALWLTLVAEGEGGHGSQPVRDSAVARLARALARIDAWETPIRITTTVDEMMRRLAPYTDFPLSVLLPRLGNPLVRRLAAGGLTGSRVTNAMVRDTIALTGLRAGLKHNVIPRRAEATLDIRLLPDTDAALFLAHLAEVIGDPTVHLEGIPDPLPAPKHPSPVDSPFFHVLEAELAVEFPGSVTVPMQTTGGTDSAFFRHRGIPAYGYFPALLDEELTSSIHGVDERVPVDALEQAVRVTWRVLRRLTAPPGSDRR